MAIVGKQARWRAESGLHPNANGASLDPVNLYLLQWRIMCNRCGSGEQL